MLMSMPLKGSAALMNHCISFNWSSLDKVDGWNSLSIHFFAAAYVGARGRGDRGGCGDQRDCARHHQDTGPGRPLTSHQMSHVGSSVAATDNFRPGLTPDLLY